MVKKYIDADYENQENKVHQEEGKSCQECDECFGRGSWYISWEYGGIEYCPKCRGTGKS